MPSSPSSHSQLHTLAIPSAARSPPSQTSSQPREAPDPNHTRRRRARLFPLGRCRRQRRRSPLKLRAWHRGRCPPARPPTCARRAPHVAGRCRRMRQLLLTGAARSLPPSAAQPGGAARPECCRAARPGFLRAAGRRLVAGTASRGLSGSLPPLHVSAGAAAERSGKAAASFPAPLPFYRGAGAAAAAAATAAAARHPRRCLPTAGPPPPPPHSHTLVRTARPSPAHLSAPRRRGPRSRPPTHRPRSRRQHRRHPQPRTRSPHRGRPGRRERRRQHGLCGYHRKATTGQARELS